MVSALQSGAGKTVLACGLMRALQQRGMRVAGFKCGPDYLDPMFHRRVLGAPSDNLDLFLQGGARVHQTLARAQADVAIIEGAMGLYDGVAGTDESSAWQLAALERLPVVLAVRPRGASLTLAAQICGALGFRNPSQVVGVILTDCREALATYLRPIIERECGIAVLGFLPPMEEAVFESRHLGLVRADEVADLDERMNAIAAQLRRSVDLDALLALAPPWDGADAGPRSKPAWVGEKAKGQHRCRIGVARDEAFCFYYEAGLARLEECGATLVPFSPLRDAELPTVDALYLGGGYPELHIRELAANAQLRAAVRDAVASGLPTVAECGGFLYLQQSLVNAAGEEQPMVGALPGRGYAAGRLVRFGYAHLRAESDSLLFRAGEAVPVHEFHHWESTENGADLTAEKPSGRSWRCCHATPTLYAGWPHLHFAGELPLAERFVARSQNPPSLLRVLRV